jgi:MFS family permease
MISCSTARYRPGLREAIFPRVRALQAFSIYTVGFVARPIGAATFGHYGDRIGRKATLIATLLLTGIATFAVGFVPTYAQIGIWGAVILTILRFIQGVGSVANGAARSCFRWSGRDRTRTAVFYHGVAAIRRASWALPGAPSHCPLFQAPSCTALRQHCGMFYSSARL